MISSLEIAWLNEGELEQALWLAVAAAHHQAPIWLLPLPQVHIHVCGFCSQHPDLQNRHPSSVTHRVAVLSSVGLVSVSEAAGVCTGLLCVQAACSLLKHQTEPVQGMEWITSGVTHQ